MIKQSPEDVAKFARWLADQHTYELGFIPSTWYTRSAALGHIRTSIDGGEFAGFLLHGPIQLRTKINQAAIAEDARLQNRARLMVLELISECAEAGVEKLTLHCATGLPANDFWRTLGFKCGALREPAGPNRRHAWRWEWTFKTGYDLDEFLNAQFNAPKTRELAKAFGLEEQMLKAFTARYRRKLQRGLGEN